MEIKIEVNEEQFKEVLNNTLASLPQEKLQEVVLEGIREYITEKDILESLLTYKGSYYSNDRRPTDFLLDIMKNAAPCERINEARDEMLECFKKNSPKIFAEALSKTILNSLFNTQEFTNYASYAANDIMMSAMSSHIQSNHS